MGSSTNAIEIYIPLLNEGTDVLRPTLGRVLDPDVVEVLATPNYDSADEEWEFPPGTRVKIAKELRAGRELLVARQKVA